MKFLRERVGFRDRHAHPTATAAQGILFARMGGNPTWLEAVLTVVLYLGFDWFLFG